MFWKGEGYLSGGKILGKLGNKYICIWQALGYGKKLEYLFANTNGEQKQARKMNMLTDLQNIGIFVSLFEGGDRFDPGGHIGSFYQLSLAESEFEVMIQEGEEDDI
ncbi:uncharacterized protein LOC108213155 isoform X2 [Daucus carota subsp. sativus]|uniref:uncharacterized protein LOC108213155 isoform X2 n=1 Tax=Daucus carota subsp. sativus TaxID=79200 RepID=UPI003083DA75